MPGRCGRCGKHVGAAEERRALGKSYHEECYTCAICHRGLDSMTIAEHRELNEIYCKGCYRLYIGPEGYGYPPNGPALISYDMEHQNPPPGSEIKWKTPPTRLGQNFLRPKTLPNGQSSAGTRSRSTSRPQSKPASPLPRSKSRSRSNTKVHSNQGVTGSRSRSKTSTHSRPGSPRPGSSVPHAPPLPPPPPPHRPSHSPVKVRSQNSKSLSNHSNKTSSGHTRKSLPATTPNHKNSSHNKIQHAFSWDDTKGNHHTPHDPHLKGHAHHSQEKVGSNHSHHSQEKVRSNHAHNSPVKIRSNHSHNSPKHSHHSHHSNSNIKTNSSHRTISGSKIPPPPPLPPPPPPKRGRSGQLSQDRVTSHHSRSPSPKKSKSGQGHTHSSGHGSQHLHQNSGHSHHSQGQIQRSRSHSPVKSRSNSAGSGSRSKTAGDPNCPPLFYCGGKCVGTPSYPRYPAHHSSSRRIPLGPSYGSVRGVPKGIGEKCRRCGRPVFQAELQLGYHGAYHTECFKCCGCGKKLDSTTVAEHQGEIFCKGCYRRNFATSGVGFGLGAGALQTP